jgi:uncharacterized membrane protein
MATFAAFHVLLILSVPWTGKWIPAPEIAAIATLDSIMMWVIIDLIEQAMKRTMPRTAEREHSL